MRSSPTTGVYLAPAELLADADLLPRLRSVGFDHVVLRAGFDPSRPDAAVEPAAAAVRGAGMTLCVLVGGWWGEGIAPGDAAMRPIAAGFPAADADTAHESRWPMHCPLGGWTATVARAVADLTRRLRPDSVCLTHARFHHAADLPGLFTDGSPAYRERMAAHNLSPRSVAEAVRRVANRLAQQTPQAILRKAGGDGMIRWLDGWLEGDVFARWFAFRRAVIDEACATIGAAAGGTGSPRPALGVNMINPLFCELSGQGLDALPASIDFVQPLLAHVRWHLVQPLERWTAWLRQTQPALREEEAWRAITTAAGLGRLADIDGLGPRIAGEGTVPVLEVFMAACLERLASCGIDPSAMQVVLRGSDWPSDWLRDAARRWRDAGFCGVMYQGFDRRLDAVG